VTDEALMSAVKDGNLGHLSVLFERYHRPLFGFFHRLLGDRGAAEDLVQDVFVRVLKYRHSFRSQGSFEPWLFQIARNARRDFMRSRRPMDSLDEEMEIAAATPGPGVRIEQQQEAALLKEALRRLPPHKRELIVLARYRGMDYEQLAAMMNADVGAIRVRLHRAIRQLGDIFCQLRGGGERRHGVPGDTAECAVRTSKIG
jgi:RNA polymerase sigma-70 factor (ECF subfamily)